MTDAVTEESQGEEIVPEGMLLTEGMPEMVEDVNGKVENVLTETSHSEKPANVKEAFPLFGNFLFRMSGPVVDLSRVRELKKNHPELYELMKQEREKILELTGVKNLSELKDISTNQEMIDKIRENIARSMADTLVPDYVKDEYARLRLSEDEMESLHYESVAVIDYVIKRFFPKESTNENSPISLVSEVENCSDVGKLVLRATDTRPPGDPENRGWEDQARFEALRDLGLMEIIANINNYLAERKQTHQGLAYLDDILNNEGIYSYKDKKKGYSKTRQLVTEHKGENNRCTSSILVDDVDDADDLASDKDLKRTSIAMRAFEVEDEDGNLIEIEGMLDSRVKTKTSMVLKMLRKNSADTEEVLKDLNGIRAVFKDNREIQLFENNLQKKLQANGHEVQIGRQKDSMGEGGLKCKKHIIEIDGRKYEMQIFTYEEFANYLYQRPYSWSEYEIKRFFESSSSEALFPREIYGDLDREKLSEIAQEEAYQYTSKKTWGKEGLSDKLAA